MRGIILILDTPYFTSTDHDGLYRLENIPPGRYRLKAWISKKIKYEKEIELNPGEVLTVDFLS